MKKTNKSKVGVSKRTEKEPKKLSKEERILQNMEENESHVHEIDVIDLNKETIEEETAEEFILQEIPEEQLEIIDINSEEEKQSIFDSREDLPHYVNEQIDSEVEDLQKKMTAMMGDRGVISKDLTNEVVDNIDIPSGEVKFYSNSKVKPTKEQDAMFVAPLDKGEIQQVKTVIYSNTSKKEDNYTERDLNSAINELMTGKNLSYLEAKAVVFDRIRRGEKLKKVITQEKVKLEPIPQVKPQAQPQVRPNNVRVESPTKIYTNKRK